MSDHGGEAHAADHGHAKDHLAEHVKLNEQYTAWRESLKNQHASVYVEAAKKHLGGGSEMHKLRDEKVRDKFVDDIVNAYMKHSGLKPKNDFERDAFLYSLIGHTRNSLSQAVNRLQENYVLDMHKAQTDEHLKEMDKIHLSTVHKPLLEYAKDHSGRKKLFKEAGLDGLVAEAEKMSAEEAANSVLSHFRGAGSETYRALTKKHVYSGADHGAHH